MPALTVRLRQAAPIPLDAGFCCPAGDLVALVGPSGSGKTTILRVIAGLARCRQGRIAVGAETWFDTSAGVDLPPQQRRVGLVFQNYALFPHLSALGNVALASDRADALAHAREVLARVQLEGFVDRRPAQLSGGQQQRVALARALVREPQVLLLDEPFSAVDQTARLDLYQELVELRRGLEIPIVLVTHDLQEAQRLADRLVILDQGSVIADGTLDEVLAAPALVQRISGLDAGTALHCRVHGHDERFGLTELEVEPGTMLRVPRVDLAVNTPVRIRVPARDVALSLSQPADVSTVNRLSGTVTALEILDATHVDVRVRIGGGVPLLARVTREATERLGLTVGLPVWCLIKSVALDRATLMMAQKRPATLSCALASAPAAANDAQAESPR